MKRLSYILLFLTTILLSSCTSYTRLSQYPKMYEEQPNVIVVMPPINKTTNVEAKDLLYTSISAPLIKSGYYVISPYIAMEMFKSESGYDAEMFIENDQQIFNKVFGADAVVYTVIEKWKKSGAAYLNTKIQYIVKSTKTNDILFERTCELFLDMSESSSDSNNSLIGALVDIATTAINTALTDHIVAARRSNYHVFQDIPRGKYSPEYMTDQENSVGKQDFSVTVK